eukprot:scaffold35475_cov101-Isochrysis_galbana.AAC.1
MNWGRPGMTLAPIEGGQQSGVRPREAVLAPSDRWRDRCRAPFGSHPPRTGRAPCRARPSPPQPAPARPAR